MAKYSNLKDLFTAIADAIRSKTGGTATIVADDFPSAIESLASTEIEDALVGSNYKLEAYTNNRVDKVRDSAFKEQKMLTSVEFSKVAEVSLDAFSGCNELSSVVMPNLYLVGDSAFIGCIRLKKIDMGSGAHEGSFLGSSCFYNTSLDTLIIRAENHVVSLGNSVFGDSNYPEYSSPIEKGTGYIYVPASMVDAYKAAENWSTYADQIRAIEDYPDITGG